MACLLTDKGYRNDIVSSRKNVTRIRVAYKRQVGGLWIGNGLEQQLLDVIDLRAQGDKI